MPCTLSCQERCATKEREGLIKKIELSNINRIDDVQSPELQRWARRHEKRMCTLMGGKTPLGPLVRETFIECACDGLRISSLFGGIV